MEETKLINMTFWIIISYLIFSIFIKTVLYTIYPDAKSFDELVIIKISRSVPIEILDNIKSEPHPFGWYFVLHALHVLNNTQLHIILILLSGLITMISAIYLKISKSLTGILILFVVLISMEYQWSTLYIRHDIITLPLLLLTTSLVFVSIQKQVESKRMYFLVGFILAIVSFLSYIQSFYIFILVFSYTLYFKKYTYATTYFILYLSCFVINMNLTLANQITQNINRFDWIHLLDSSVINGVFRFFSGEFLTSYKSNYINHVSFWFIIIGLFLQFKYGKKSTIFFCFGTLFALGVVYTLNGFFVNPRYSIPFFLVLIFSSIDGYQKFFIVAPNYIRLNSINITIIMFISTGIIFITNLINLKTVVETSNSSQNLSSIKIYLKNNMEKEYILISPNSEWAYFIKDEYLKDIHNVHPSYFAEIASIKFNNADPIFSLGYNRNEPPDIRSAQKILSTSLIKNYIYISDDTFDIAKVILSALSKTCYKHKIYPPVMSVFEDCINY